MENSIYGSIGNIDGQLNIWLDEYSEKTLIGNVHSVFDKVINIISINQDYLFSLALEEVVQSPQMMKTIDKDCFQNVKDVIQTGTPVFRNGVNEIKIQNIIWNFGNAKIWNGNITEEYIKQNRLNICHLKEISDFVQMNGADSGLLSAWCEYSHKELLVKKNVNIYAPIFLDRLKKMEDAVRENNNIKLLDASYEFVGMGMGLTPSGDDFILGCLAVWKYWGSRLYDIYVDNEWIERLKGRTTTVSYFMLKNCIDGFVNESLLKLLQYKSENTEKNHINSLLQDLLKIGSTSGTDMLVGVIFAYELAFYQK